jgi:hypothetical protein
MQVTNLSNWADSASPDATLTPAALDAWDAYLAEQSKKFPGLWR